MGLKYIPICFRKCVEMKRTLDSVFEEILRLGINFEKLNSSRTVEEKQKSKVNIYFIHTMAFVIDSKRQLNQGLKGFVLWKSQLNILFPHNF